MLTFLINISLLTLLTMSLAADLKYRRIFNCITLPAIAAGLILNGFESGPHGFQLSLYGILLGVALMAIPFVKGGMGGGDVKMLAAIGALKGPEFVFCAFLAGALAGGVMAVASVCLSKRRSETAAGLKNMCLTWKTIDRDYFKQNTIVKTQSIPYAAAITAGAATAWFALPIVAFWR